MLILSRTIRHACIIPFLGAALVVFDFDARAANQSLNQTDPSALTPFGIGSCYINNRSAQDNARWIPQMAAIGIHMTRTSHTAWDNVEPREGQWTWDALDKQMNFMASNHMEFGGILIGSVPWDKTNSVGLPVDNIPAWSNYVFHVVQHVGKRVKYWEVWNEPPNFIGPKQTAADYAKVLVSAYEAAKKANPD